MDISCCNPGIQIKSETHKNLFNHSPVIATWKSYSLLVSHEGALSSTPAKSWCFRFTPNVTVDRLSVHICLFQSITSLRIICVSVHYITAYYLCFSVLPHCVLSDLCWDGAPQMVSEIHHTVQGKKSGNKGLNKSCLSSHNCLSTLHIHAES